jgi:phage tail-like protein
MPKTIPGKLIVTAPDQAPQEVILDQPVLHIGRLSAPENEVSLVHGLVSRRHAQIFCDRMPYRITDLGSSNGTQVNDIPLPANEVRELHDGDVIAIGPFTLRYQAPQVEEEPSAVPAPEAEPAVVQEVAAGGEPEPVPEAEAAPEEEPDLFAGIKLEAAPAPPPPPPERPPPGEARPAERPHVPWVGMPFDRSRWLQYLPYMYSDHPFLGRYMLIFEDLFGPLDQTIAHFDLFLDPRTAPESYLSVLADWLGLVLDDRWPAERRRAVLRSAVEMYDFRGTKKGLTQLLEASTECKVDVAENTDGPHTFRVVITPPKGKDVDEQMIRHLIDTNKPAHTVYKLQIKSRRR